MIGSFYMPGRSLLHFFDPRCKLILLVLLAVLFFLPVRVELLALYLLAVALLALIFLGIRDLLRTMRVIAPILLLVLLLTPPFHREGRVLLAVFRFRLVTWEGLLEALRLIIRFTGITLIFFSFLRSTDPDSLILALRWFGLPFAAALIISIALQYIPALKALYDQVLDAHRLRRATGSEERKAGKGWRRRLAQAVPVLTSVLIQAIRRIPVLAMALEVRGVGRKDPRSRFHSLKTGPALYRDVLFGIAAAAAVITPVMLFH